MVKNIPLGQPTFGIEEQSALINVSKQKWILNGPKVREFEDVFANWIGAPYAAAVSSCTAGMHTSYSALGFEEGSEIILPAFNFIADGLAILQANLVPRFVDVNIRTGNLDPESIEHAVNSRTKAILVLHYSGLLAEMDEILKIAEKHGLKVIEDASHSLGSTYKDKYAGTLGDIGVYSFGPVKTITTAGMGGMVVAKDVELIENVKKLSSYGMSKTAWERKSSSDISSYQVHDLGHNFRMTDFQAAVGIEQMYKLDQFISSRNRLCNLYDKLLSNIHCLQLMPAIESANSCRLYYTIITNFEDPKNRDALVVHLRNKGIGAAVHWNPPLHQHPLFQCSQEFNNSSFLAARIISLPLYPTLTEEEVEYSAKIVKSFSLSFDQ